MVVILVVGAAGFWAVPPCIRISIRAKHRRGCGLRRWSRNRNMSSSNSLLTKARWTHYICWHNTQQRSIWNLSCTKYPKSGNKTKGLKCVWVYYYTLFKQLMSLVQSIVYTWLVQSIVCCQGYRIKSVAISHSRFQADVQTWNVRVIMTGSILKFISKVLFKDNQICHRNNSLDHVSINT